jgi:AraC-like DNA-binding protein
MELIRKRPELTNQQLGNYVGFGDKTSYFGEAFRKTTGMTVRQYRKTISEEDANNAASKQE